MRDESICHREASKASRFSFPVGSCSGCRKDVEVVQHRRSVDCDIEQSLSGRSPAKLREVQTYCVNRAFNPEKV
jgi:hypothetical protein